MREATDAGEAREAVERSTRRLEEDQGRWPQVRHMAAALVHTYEADHFSERVKRAFGGRP
jgi:hypothetical protein